MVSNLVGSIDIFEIMSKKLSTIVATEPDTPLNDADPVGSFDKS